MRTGPLTGVLFSFMPFAQDFQQILAYYLLNIQKLRCFPVFRKKVLHNHRCTAMIRIIQYFSE